MDNLIGNSFALHPERINRKGRPKRIPDLDKLLLSVCGSGEESKMRDVLETLINMAIDGNIRAIEILLNRVYGKVKENVDITSAGDALPKTTIHFIGSTEE